MCLASRWIRRHLPIGQNSLDGIRDPWWTNLPPIRTMATNVIPAVPGSFSAGKSWGKKSLLHVFILVQKRVSFNPFFRLLGPLSHIVTSAASLSQESNEKSRVALVALTLETQVGCCCARTLIFSEMLSVKVDQKLKKKTKYFDELFFW